MAAEADPAFARHFDASSPSHQKNHI